MKAYTIHHYDNNAVELICVNTNARVVVYNTGDVVEFLDGIPVAVKTHDGFLWQDKAIYHTMFNALNEYTTAVFNLQLKRI